MKAADKLQWRLELGAFSRPISEQLAEQGLELKPGEDVYFFQKDADAITRCSIRGLVADSVVVKARRKLMDNIADQVVRV